MKSRAVLLVFAILLNWLFASGQCPSIDFVAPPNACLNETISLVNSSDVGLYEWDFCTGDLNNPPSAQLSYTLPGAIGGPSIEFAFDDGKWFGFVTGTWTNSLYRLEFVNGVQNAPTTIENLGSLSGELEGPGQIRLLKEGNQWYGLVINTDTNELLKLSFGDKLSNSIITSVLVTGVGFTNSGIAVGKDQTNGWICIISNSPGNKFTIIKMGNGLIPPTAGDIIISGFVPNPNNLGDVDIIFDCGLWFGFAVNYGNGNLYRLDFGSQLFQTPVITQLNGSDPGNGGRLRVLKEGESFFLMVTNLSGKFYKVDFGSDLSNATPLITNEGDFGSILQNSYGFGIAIQNSLWTMSVINASSGKISNVTYPNICSVNIQQVGETPHINYTIPGNYLVSLKVTNALGSSSVLTKNILINSVPAPDINFSSQNICARNDVNFTSQNSSNNITSYDWNFGDATPNSSIPNPVKQFSASGNFVINLLVTATNGCKNNAFGSLSIYDPPISQFSTPSVLPCTNNLLTFLNTTPDNFDGNLSYQWSVNGIDKSQERDLKYTFTATGDNNVKLKTSIPGCESEVEKVIVDVKSGPTVGFTYNGFCEQENISFNNISIGDISSYAWDFGNAQTSNDVNPIKIFATGLYNITLNTTATNGCISSTSQDINVHAKPIVDFKIISSQLLCTNAETVFLDLTTFSDEQSISTWDWKFGGNDIASIQNPKHTFTTKGDNTVALTVKTNFGCSSVKQKTFSFNPSPPSDFTYSTACNNLPVNFTSSTGSIYSWQWQIGNKSYDVANPVHVFRTPGSYDANLKVVGINGCESNTFQSINVPVPLIPEFTVEKNCINENAVFTDVTIGDDAVVEQSWNINDEENLVGNPVIYKFKTLGEKNILFTVKSKVGCTYTSTRNISVVNFPNAGFTSNQDIGAPPVAISFSNTSTDASKYLWDFGDGKSSEEKSPEHNFTATGNLNILLTAFNEEGCSDQFIKTIVLSPPYPDVNIMAITTSENPDHTIKVVITFQNDGNTVLKNLPVDIDVSGNVNLRELIDGPIMPSSRFNLTLAYGLRKATDLKFICAEIPLANDQNPEENRNCIQFNTETLILPGYPNPVKDFLTVEWISTDEKPIRASLYTSLGIKVLGFEFTTEKGLNQEVMSVESLQNGIYMLVLESATQKSVQKLLLTR